MSAPSETQTDARRETRELLEGFHGEASELIPILQEIQERFGYIPQESMREAARFLNMPEASVYGVATFYAQFNFTPQGRHRVKVCLGTACHVRGATAIVEAITRELGIRPGETTADMEFSVERVACFGSCALAPVVVVDGKYYARVTPDSAVEILRNLPPQGAAEEEPEA